MIREAFRLQQGHLTEPVVLVLVARPSLASRGLEAVSRDLRRCLKESGLWRDDIPSAGLDPVRSHDSPSSPASAQAAS
jgi:RNase P protein component